MRFVDEARINVRSGRGGDGCLSFRRERNIPRGGPNGGDGGRGGSVFLRASQSLNTLIDLRYHRVHKAEAGRRGEGRERYGRGGEDYFIDIPVGTIIRDADTGETLAELMSPGQTVCVARGGKGGLGNIHFKSSVNQTPRQITTGGLGEERNLHMELRLLADVGLLGQPNAGKSTLLSSISAARPKIADYPFTTLYPELGVVLVGESNSFVMADIPGLIEGAAEGAGLGIRFLKHLQRCRLLLHVVDMLGPQYNEDRQQRIANVIAEGEQTVTELERFSDSLASRERWLVLNKIDAVPAEERDELIAALKQGFGGDMPCFAVSAVSGEGTRPLVQAIMQWINDHPVVASNDVLDEDTLFDDPAETIYRVTPTDDDDDEWDDADADADADIEFDDADESR
ncbi:GTPase ObgE [Gammaproteobacteria bacterium]|nr:GTPase ObgE [Gammaproteobacteria bacterium]